MSKQVARSRWSGARWHRMTGVEDGNPVLLCNRKTGRGYYWGKPEIAEEGVLYERPYYRPKYVSVTCANCINIEARQAIEAAQ